MKFDFTKNKILFFNVQIEGLDSAKLKFLFSILIDGVHYGFTGALDGSKVKIDVPAFNTFMKDKIIADGKSYEASLIAYDGKFCVEPWKDSISFDITPMITAKLTSESAKVKASIEPEVIVEQIQDKVIDYTDMDQDLITQDTARNYASQTMGATQGLTHATNPAKENEELEEDEDLHLERYDLSIGKDKVREIVKKIRLENKQKKLSTKKVKNEEIDLYNQDLGIGREKVVDIAKKSMKESKVFEPTTKKHLKLFLESRGMKSEDTQERLLERAAELGGDDIPSQYKTLRKMIGLDKPAGVFDVAEKLWKKHQERGE